MEPVLHDPITYANWVWILGAGLIAIALVWGASLLWAYRTSRVRPPETVWELRALQRRRYMRQISQVETEYADGMMSGVDCHFALASLIRAAATEKTRLNVETMTAKEAAERFPQWPGLSAALAWCEDHTFPATSGRTPDMDARVEYGVQLARAVVDA